MERVLTSLIEVKLTQQRHSQCFVDLLNESEPQLPFVKIEDLLEFDEELSRSKEAWAGMVHKFIL